MVPAAKIKPGTHCPDWRYSSRTVIKGEGQLACIAAASVLAKVTRDAEMTVLEQKHPGYGFARHKGYPTQAHRAALARLGPCPAHRRSFAPVARMPS